MSGIPTLFKIARLSDNCGPFSNKPCPTPRKWHHVKGPLVMCANGWHATSRPSRYRAGNPVRVYLADVKGKILVDGDKICAASIRLVEIHSDWPFLPLFPEVKVLLFEAWRFEHKTEPYPSWANLSRANLSLANLSGADLSGADLSGADLSRADLGEWRRGPDGFARKQL